MIRKTLATGWLLIAVPFGGVAAFQLWSMLAGYYDPVLHDGVPPEHVPERLIRLVTIIVIAFSSSLLAGWFLSRTSERD